MSFLTLTIKGEPKAQPRVKAASRGSFIQIYTPGNAKAWKKLVREAAIKARQSMNEWLEGPLQVDMQFRMPRPKKHYLRGVLRKNAPRWHTKKPDKDNLEKAVMDALTDAGLWKDDSLVCKGDVEKVFADVPEIVGCTVIISKL